MARKHGLEDDAIIFDASVLIFKEHFDEAISKLTSIVNSKSLQLRGLAFDRMGIAYNAKQELNKSIECYEKA